MIDIYILRFSNLKLFFRFCSGLLLWQRTIGHLHGHGQFSANCDAVRHNLANRRHEQIAAVGGVRPATDEIDGKSPFYSAARVEHESGLCLRGIRIHGRVDTSIFNY